MKSRGGTGDFKSPGTPDSPTTKKKRRTSTTPATPPAVQSSPMPELVPPPPITGMHGYGDTLIASNPFDDSPSQSRGPPPGGPGPSQQMPPQGPPPHHQQHMMPMRMPCPPQGPPQGHPHMGGGLPPQTQWNGPPKPPLPPMQSGKMYPADQPMVFNPQNPNAPPIYPCGVCHKEVHDNDQAIPCESGCNFWFHRICTGLTEAAYHFLTQEVYAEWVCDKCLTHKNIPLVKFKP